MVDVAVALDDTVERLREADGRTAGQDAMLQFYAEHGKPPTSKELDAAVAGRAPVDEGVLLARAVRKLQAAAEFEEGQADAAEQAAQRAAGDKVGKAADRLADAEAQAAEAAAAARAARERADDARAVGDAAAAAAADRVEGALPDAPAGRDVNVTPQTAG